MKILLSFSPPAELEMEFLVSVVVDNAEQPSEPSNKVRCPPQPQLATSDVALQSAATQLLMSGELTGVPFEANLLHNPTGLKAKRLLLLRGGAAKKFTGYDLRRLSGAAVRTLKERDIRSFAFVSPSGIPAKEAVKAIVEGAMIGNFNPDYYRSNRRDQRIDTLTIVHEGRGAAQPWKKSHKKL